MDIDWEYPCSQPRTDHVKISDQKFDTVTDQGGDCGNGEYAHGVCTGSCIDGKNLIQFYTEARAKFGSSFILSIAASASLFTVKEAYNVPELDKLLDRWNLMSYDFFVADIASASKTAPNENLNDPEASSGLFQWGVNYAV